MGQQNHRENESRNNNRSLRRERAPPNNTKDPNAQYIKIVKVNAPSFNERLDPQAYIDWQLVIDCYFHWRDISKSRKIRFTVMKLTGQAGQYWKNLERMMRYRRDDLVETWEGIKEKLKLK